MSQLSARMKDQLCAEVHHKYLQQKKGRPSTPFYPTNATHCATRLPPIESEMSIKSESNTEKARPGSKSDFSILRFRFNDDDLHNKNCPIGRDESITSHYSKTLTDELPLSASLFESSTSFGSRRLQNIKKLNQIPENDLVKKWSESAYAQSLQEKPKRNYGTNEVLSIAIQSYGRGVKVSRTCQRNRTKIKPPPTTLPPITEVMEPQSFMTKFKPIKVNNDRVVVARDRRKFHEHGLYKNPRPFDHRGVRTSALD